MKLKSHSRVYLYEDGLVRFASEKYSNNTEHLDNKYVHLTNYALNRDNIKETDQNCVKLTLTDLKNYFSQQCLDWTSVWDEIKQVCVKTVLCGHYQMLTGLESSSLSDYHCYKIFGFDLMIDEALKPWLLEVNSFPSMFPQSPGINTVEIKIIMLIM